MKVRDVSARAAEDAANDGRTLNYVSHLQPKLQVVAFATTSHAKKRATLNCVALFFGARCETWTHTVSHTPLKRARLPIPPISHCLYIIVDCLPFVKSQIYRQKSSFFSFSVTRFDLPISFVKRDGTPLCKRKNAILTFVSLRLYKWWRRKARKEWKN